MMIASHDAIGQLEGVAVDEGGAENIALARPRGGDEILHVIPAQLNHAC
jgi:hypothetical protein